MLLFEPPPTQGDLHFRAFGFPVRVHPFFWITAVLMGLRGAGGTPPAEMLIWIVVVFISILVHELGHAFAFRRYGGRPWITLHAIGGLASCDDYDERPWHDVAIALAGPGAGFILAAVALGFVGLSGHAFGWVPGETGPLSVAMEGSMLGGTFYWQPLGSRLADSLFWDVLQVNIFWGLINLLPVYPLDGGRVARELCMLRSPRSGIILSLQISIAVGAAMAFVGFFATQSIFMAIMFGYLAYANYQTLQAYRRPRW
jgi:stage IV sporulation protein FB